MGSEKNTVQVTGEAAIPTSLRQKHDTLLRGYMYMIFKVYVTPNILFLI